MNILWSPIELDPEGPNLRGQVALIMEDIEERAKQDQEKYGTGYSFMTFTEYTMRKKLLPYLNKYAGKYINSETPLLVYMFDKYLKGTFIIQEEE